MKIKLEFDTSKDLPFFLYAAGGLASVILGVITGVIGLSGIVAAIQGVEDLFFISIALTILGIIEVIIPVWGFEWARYTKKTGMGERRVMDTIGITLLANLFGIVLLALLMTIGIMSAFTGDFSSSGGSGSGDFSDAMRPLELILFLEILLPASLFPSYTLYLRSYWQKSPFSQLPQPYQPPQYPPTVRNDTPETQDIHKTDAPEPPKKMKPIPIKKKKLKGEI